MWEPALEDPRRFDVRWIVMRGPEKADTVFDALNGGGDLVGYREVHRNSEYVIFEERP
jgi:hypothetical protein